MFKVEFTNYNNDFDKFLETKSFYDLGDFENFLIKENEKRDGTSKSSKYWKSPIGTRKEKDGSLIGWYKTNASNSKYALWLKKVTTENGTVVFESGYYCSPKFFDFLNKVNEKICQKEIYGDF